MGESGRCVRRLWEWRAESLGTARRGGDGRVFMMANEGVMDGGGIGRTAYL